MDWHTSNSNVEVEWLEFAYFTILIQQSTLQVLGVWSYQWNAWRWRQPHFSYSQTDWKIPYKYKVPTCTEPWRTYITCHPEIKCIARSRPASSAREDEDDSTTPCWLPNIHGMLLYQALVTCEHGEWWWMWTCSRFCSAFAIFRKGRWLLFQ
jgi:hypothetical protein